MHKCAATLLGLLILLLPSLALAATVVPRLEPTDDIIRNGRDLEWSQPAGVDDSYAEKQRDFQAWMRETYRAWKSQWREPLDAERFGAEHRRVRKIITAAHRRAVRTRQWHVRSTVLLSEGGPSQPAAPTRAYSRPSRRSIVAESQMRSVREMARITR